jgi:mRNA interferase MazF
VARKVKVIRPRRGEIYLVNFDPALGAEIKKTRPALVLQNDIANRHSPITIVAAITSKYDKALPDRGTVLRNRKVGLLETLSYF